MPVGTRLVNAGAVEVIIVHRILIMTALQQKMVDLTIKRTRKIGMVM
jgi:hypothetical protein